MRELTLLFATICLAGPAWAGAPAGLDLTGTWVGGLKCTEFGEDGSSKFPTEVDLEISHAGDDLAVDWVGTAGLYAGLSIPDPRDPTGRGVVSLVDCETDSDPLTGFGEMSILKAKVDRDRGKGILRGESNYTFIDDGNFIGACKWKFKLVDTTDPVIAGCPLK